MKRVLGGGQLLADMDGFKSTEGIVVIAATNFPEVLDKALMRCPPPPLETPPLTPHTHTSSDSGYSTRPSCGAPRPHHTPPTYLRARAHTHTQDTSSDAGTWAGSP